nr:carbon starvation CstA 5TM domain-containing protein [Quadrisphaera sp. INWT6]
MGYFLYTGVTDPLGGINQLFPLFGIANQLLAAIALTLCTTLLIKHGRARYAWVTGVPLAWDLVVTMAASWQKVFSSNPAIGYFAQASRYREALAAGEVLAPAKDAAQMQQVVTNSTTNGVLQSLFAVLVLVVAANAALVVVRALRAGSLPTTEVPFEESRLVEPAGMLATPAEKEALRQHAAAGGRASGGHGGRGSAHGGGHG